MPLHLIWFQYFENFQVMITIHSSKRFCMVDTQFDCLMEHPCWTKLNTSQMQIPSNSWAGLGRAVVCQCECQCECEWGSDPILTYFVLCYPWSQSMCRWYDCPTLDILKSFFGDSVKDQISKLNKLIILRFRPVTQTDSTLIQIQFS